VGEYSARTASRGAAPVAAAAAPAEAAFSSDDLQSVARLITGLSRAEATAAVTRSGLGAAVTKAWLDGSLLSALKNAGLIREDGGVYYMT
jgi:formiminotetrahydrofolate cyclodeaminase